MGKKIALGQGLAAVATAVVPEPLSLEEKVSLLTKQVEDLTKAFNAVNRVQLKERRHQDAHDNNPLQSLNKDSIPVGLSLVGTSTRGGTHVLTVYADGYYIGSLKYDSLSAAAEAASGVRRSGWTYWKMPDGRTVKEAFGKV